MHLTFKNYGPRAVEKPSEIAKRLNVNLGDEKTHYESLAMKSYQNPPSDFQKVKPSLDKVASTKTNYSLGEERMEF